MKNIKKIGKAVAGSALLLGATLAGGAAFASAQDGSSGTTLGDYPAPYVGEDGNVDASIVVGSSAKAMDVVGAVDIAGSLSQAAFTEDTVEAGSGSFGWSATDGVTLDTRNDQLYFTDELDDVRETLTEDQLSALSETTFRDDAGDETDVEYFLYPGNQQVTFGKPDDRNNEDPILYVDNPASPDKTGNLFKLQANMEESIAFNSSDVEDEEIELFGKEYTVSTDTTGDELVLFGSQEEYDIETGQSQTITVDGNEHTFEVVAVTGSDTTAFRVDGQLREENEDDKFDLEGQEVRITDIIQTSSDNSEGVVSFGLGSEELHLTNDNPVEDGDSDDIDGTHVVFNGDTGATDPVADLSSIEIYVGAEDDDHEYVMAGESYSHSMFEDFEFHFGGLNPTTAEDDVNEVQVTSSGDDTVTASFTARGGDEATVEWANTAKATNTDFSLADDDEDKIHVVEGTKVQEDEYFFSDAGDFAHMWEVTGIDVDEEDPGSTADGDEATVDLRDAVTGNSVEVTLDETASGATDGDQEYTGTEVIDGQTYQFGVDTQDTAKSSDNQVVATWDSSAGITNTNVNTGDRISLSPALDLVGGSAFALTKPVTGESADVNDANVYEVPSTESTDAQVMNISYTGTNLLVDEGNDGSYELNLSGGEDGAVSVGGLDYNVSHSSSGSHSIYVADSNGLQTHSPAAVAMEPEDDQDNENAYVEVPSVDTGDEEIDVNSPVYTGSSTDRKDATLESDDDVTAAYDLFGTYSEYDSDEQGEVTLSIPNGQATAGAAVTTQGGSLDASGSAGSVTTQTPAGWGDVGALDSDSNIGQLKNNRDLILVGGPVVNSLTKELADAGDTQTASDYAEGQAMVQQIDDAFNEGNDAIVVAGQTKEDTREAANFLADYESNQDRMAGSDKVELTTAQSTE